jgi:hypothetical protein
MTAIPVTAIVKRSRLFCAPCTGRAGRTGGGGRTSLSGMVLALKFEESSSDKEVYRF